MEFLYRSAVIRPARSLIVAAIGTALLAPGLARLELRTEGRALAPSTAAAVQRDQAVRSEFDVEDPFVLLVRPVSGDVYDEQVLRLIENLTEAVRRDLDLPAHRVASLATEKGDRVFPGTLDFRRYLDPLPETARELERLRSAVEAIEIHAGTVVSSDGKAAAVFVGAPKDRDRHELYARLVGIAGARGGDVARIDVIGAPVAEALLGVHILLDLGIPRGWIPTWPSDASSGQRDGPGGPTRWAPVEGIGLVPLAVLVMAAVFVAAFRRPVAAALPLLEVAACLIAVFGAMGWFGVPIYLTTTILPVILVSIGVADEVHILSCYRRRLSALPEESRHDAVRGAMSEIAPPIVQTSLTTAAAFLAFAVSPIDAVRSFGVFASFGIVLCMTWSLGVTPALLVLTPREWLVPVGSSPGTPPTVWLAAWALRRRRTVLIVTLLLGATAVFAASTLRVQDGWISGFARDSEFRRTTEAFNDGFLGTHLLLVRIGAEPDVRSGLIRVDAVDHHRLILPASLVDDPATLVGSRISLLAGGASELAWESWVEEATRAREGIGVRTSPADGSPRTALRSHEGERIRFELTRSPLLIPESLRRLGGLEAAVAARRDLAVGGVRGPFDFVTTTSFIAYGRREGSRAVPDRPDRLRWLWDRLAIIRGPERFAQLIKDDRSAALMTVYLGDANYADTARLMQAIREYEREHLADLGFELSFAGDVAVSQALIEGVVTSQVRSLLMSLGVIVLLASWLGRSLRFGLLTVVPCALAVLIDFAVMGLTGMPLGVATSMFAGMVLGVGVDYAIHFVARYRRCQESGLPAEAAVAEAARVAGPPIAIDAVAVGLGFGVLTLSRVPANARLGMLAMLCIATCLAATILVLPALLARASRNRT